MPEDQLKLSDAEAPSAIKNGNGGNILHLFERAIEKFGGDQAESAVLVLGQLMDMHERIERRDAEKAFNAGMVKFQQRCPAIPQNRHAKFATRSGGSCGYSYADINQIRRYVTPILNELGFTYRLNQEYRDGRVFVSFILSHENGHTRTSSFSCPEESASAASSQQKSGIADTYAARRAMKHALGIMDDDDTDGASSNGIGVTISKDQVADLSRKITESGANEEKFLVFMGAASLDAISVDNYPKALHALNQKQGGRK